MTVGGPTYQDAMHAFSGKSVKPAARSTVPAAPKATGGGLNPVQRGAQQLKSSLTNTDFTAKRKAMTKRFTSTVSNRLKNIGNTLFKTGSEMKDIDAALFDELVKEAAKPEGVDPTLHRASRHAIGVSKAKRALAKTRDDVREALKSEGPKAYKGSGAAGGKRAIRSAEIDYKLSKLRAAHSKSQAFGGPARRAFMKGHEAPSNRARYSERARSEGARWKSKAGKTPDYSGTASRYYKGKGRAIRDWAGFGKRQPVDMMALHEKGRRREQGAAFRSDVRGQRRAEDEAIYRAKKRAGESPTIKEHVLAVLRKFGK